MNQTEESIMLMQKNEKLREQLNEAEKQLEIARDKAERYHMHYHELYDGTVGKLEEWVRKERTHKEVHDYTVAGFWIGFAAVMCTMIVMWS